MEIPDYERTEAEAMTREQAIEIYAQCAQDLDRWPPPREVLEFVLRDRTLWNDLIPLCAGDWWADAEHLCPLLETIDPNLTFELASHFFQVGNPRVTTDVYWYFRKIAARWDFRSFQTVWRDQPFEVRRAFIETVFEKEESDRRECPEHFEVRHHGERHGHSELWLPVLPYYPSAAVRELRRLVQDTGDTEGQRLVEEIIAERRAAFAQAAHTGSPRTYQLSPDEREVVARLMNLAVRAGFRRAALPPIRLSDEPPPLFVTNPELEEELETEDEGPRGEPQQGRNELEVSRDRQRFRPETLSIEELLGCYLPRSGEIVLWRRGLAWCARLLASHRASSADDVEPWLRAVVIIHELAHWMMHKLRGPAVAEWPTEAYLAAEEAVHEGWAQLLTHYVAKSLGGRFRSTFDALNRRQSAVYQVWQQFQRVASDKAFACLDRLRRLAPPASLQDWQELMQ